MEILAALLDLLRQADHQLRLVVVRLVKPTPIENDRIDAPVTERRFFLFEAKKIASNLP